MSVKQVARLFRRSETLTRRRLKANGYQAKEVYKYSMPTWVKRADWKQPNIVISRKFKVSRERVRQFRVKLGHPKVECRGRRK